RQDSPGRPVSSCSLAAPDCPGKTVRLGSSIPVENGAQPDPGKGPAHAGRRRRPKLPPAVQLLAPSDDSQHRLADPNRFEARTPYDAEISPQASFQFDLRNPGQLLGFACGPSDQ